MDIRFDPVADTTRRAAIVGELRRAILCGQLRPGDKVNELKIAAQMRVSRAPLREAIRELVQQGLLTNIPYAGAYVVTLTAKDIEDAYAFHHVLEDFALALVWPMRSRQFRDELERRHSVVKAATRAVDLTAQIEAALKLHGLIYEWADNAVLLDSWQRLANRLQMIFALHQQVSTEPVPRMDIHEDYVRLLKGDDLSAAKAHAHDHINMNFEELLAYARSLESKKA